MSEYWNVQLIRCRRRSVGIRITDEGQIVVRAPLRMPEREIREVLESKRGWMEKTLAKIRSRERLPKFTEEELKALAKQAKKDLPLRTAAWSRQVGVTYGRIAVRKQKTLWGSCSSKGNLNFNCLLMLCPEEVRNYVVVHELCHRKELNHSARFWAEVERVLPDYKTSLRWLKKEGQDIIARM